ncbi:MAG: glycosyltransferase family 2 protein [Lentisphaerae bacterium]|nr:glycosyltransferase family 2 protein [Lentisphaerota bacterium]
MAPLFSIIIPVYDVEPYLKKCLDSVINQTFKDWECICVDDGSPDRCGEILDEYKNMMVAKGLGEKFIVVHQENKGVSGARNSALEIASGTWVQFLDSDDALESDFLEKLAKAVDKNPDVDTIEHVAVYCYMDGKKLIGGKDRLPAKGFLKCDDILADPFGVKYTNLARCSCYKIFRRSVIEQNQLRFMEGIPISEDELFAIQFYAEAGISAICPEITGYKRIFREGSALMSMTYEKLVPKFSWLEEVYKTWQKHKTSGMTVRYCACIVGMAYLGNEYDREIRRKCIEATLDSSFYNTCAIPFLMKHGTWKSRIFAVVYYFSPKMLRRKILQYLGKGK